jgi:enoyl-CoA hydratase/carnithine racemase
MAIIPDYEFKYCKYWEDPPIATFMWSDPAVRNAYNVRSWEGFNQAYERVRDNDDIRVLVVTGDPEGKNFCGGLNVKAVFQGSLQRAGKEAELKDREGQLDASKYFMEAELTPGTPEYERRQKGLTEGGTWDARMAVTDLKPRLPGTPGWTEGRLRYEMWRKHEGAQHAFKLMELDKPVIAMVNGGCYGAGTDIAFCCDLIIASEERATFEWTYIRRGMVPPDGATFFLPRIAGRHIALELMWRGKSISARQAYEWGLINHVVSDAELKGYTYGLANELATESPPMIMGVIKDVVHKGYNDFIHQFKNHFEYLVGVGNLIYRGSDDELEGMRAFVEKRAPNYKFR